MKTFNLIPLMAFVFLMGACGEKREPEAPEAVAESPQEFQDPNDAMSSWHNAWNSRDPKQIQGLAASDAVLVLNGREVPADSLAGFYQEAGSVMKDLELRSLKKGSTDHLAYDTGLFTHSYTTDTTKYRGSYTFVWERTDEDNEWKVKAMNISDTRNYQE
ncbi:nuclear transport factor 2 family protein [Antarcticibacterium arcticum]|uniref:Nuclear transport factor 2 family protein n=1 Tax=Antarcticibacterium arcticum TaxID=2585771 RepID=A0A5B8YKV7_9FLAO|nr:nuclear transport factor 2 family protein [Antarcticibacterium arcticum]QED38630.1 nuclear transport factor 2 family protein [Antarcticibacterium arcticum]